MAYYSGMGDYYRGDYYRGDFLGILKKVGGVALKVAGAALGIRAPVPLPPGGGIMAPAPTFPNLPGPIVRAGRAVGLVPRSPQGMPAPMNFGPSIESMRGAAPIAGVCPPGFHPCKSDNCRNPCVRNRRMNPANPKALRRGLRRISGFAKLAARSRRDIGRAATAAGVRRGTPKRKR